MVGLGACENRGKIAPAKTANALIFPKRFKDYSLTVLSFPEKALFGHTQKPVLQGAWLVVPHMLRDGLTIQSKIVGDSERYLEKWRN